MCLDEFTRLKDILFFHRGIFLRKFDVPLTFIIYKLLKVHSYYVHFRFLPFQNLNIIFSVSHMP